MQQGYIKLFRQLQDNEIWTQEKFTDGQAWVDLLLLANYKPGMIKRRGVRVCVDRGMVGHGIRGLAKRWKWSVGKVSRFLKYLENEHQIERKISTQTDTKNTSVSSCIYIINYDKYQVNDNEDGYEDGTKTDTKTERRQVQNKKEENGKHGKNGKKTTKKTYIGQFDFERFWTAYPKNVKKKDALRKWTILKPTPELIDIILTAIEDQKNTTWNGKEKQYIPAPDVWLNKEQWNDELIQPGPQKEQWEIDVENENAEQEKQEALESEGS